MEGLLASGIPLAPALLPPPSQFGGVRTIAGSRAKKKPPLKLLGLCRLGSNEDAANVYPGPSQNKWGSVDTDILEDSVSSSSGESEMNSGDIWKLFNDAQRNIIYLNKQRIMALEELNKFTREKQLLLERIKQLEAGNRAVVMEGSHIKSLRSSSFCELLLRIDAMIISGIIGSEEASDLRRVVTEHKIGIADAFSDIQQKTDKELLAELCHFSDKTLRKKLHIVHICSAMYPIVPVGSVASYVTGLSCALQKRGNVVEVILPKYANMNLDAVQGLRKVDAEVYSYFSGHWHKNQIWIGVIYDIGVTFIEPLYHSTFFNRELVFGYSDDFERFSYFSRAALDYLVKTGKQPDILHIHNWETSIVGPLFWDIFVHQGLAGTRILLTCHGFSSQCLVKPEKLELCGLDPYQLHRPDRLQDNNETHLANILKGGIVYSNKVVIASFIHTKYSITHSLQHGLESTLTNHKEKLLISPYGIDGEKWDPSKDKFLPAQYSANDIKGKAVCKIALRHHLGLSGHASTIIGCLYSEVSEVDLENLKVAIWHALRKGAQFVFMSLGSVVPTNSALQAFQELKDENIRFINEYDEALFHLVLAGSDIVLVSSFHDPVFQAPLKAIKYGTAPLAINLRDMQEHDYKSKDGFRQTKARDFGSTTVSQSVLFSFANTPLNEALDEIENDPSGWLRRIRDGMSRDLSWSAEPHDIHWSAYVSLKNM